MTRGPDPIEALREVTVVVALPSPAMNGVTVFASNLTRGLQQRGVSAHILLTETRSGLVSADGPMMSLPDDVAVHELQVGGRETWGARWGAMLRYLEQRAPCLYLPNHDWRHSNISSRLSGRVGVVGIAHSDDPLHYDHVARLGRHWNAVVATSQAIARRVAAADPALAARIHTIPIGVPIAAAPPQRPRDASEPLRAIYHGRLAEHQKRISDLARVFELLHQRGAPVRLTVAGGGPEERWLRERTQGLVAAGVVRFVGAVAHDQIPALLDEHDAFVLTSAFEGLPNALVEAMGRALVPVVASTPTGFDGLIREGHSGFLVDVGDCEVFAERLSWLQRNPEPCRAMGAAARRATIEAGLRCEDMLDRYIELFSGVMEELRQGELGRRRGLLRLPPREVAGTKVFDVSYARQIGDVGIFPSYCADYEGFCREVDTLPGQRAPRWQPDHVRPYPNAVVSATSGRVSGVDVFSANLVRALSGLDLAAHVLMTSHDDVTPDPMPMPEDIPVRHLAVNRQMSWRQRWDLLRDYLEREAPCVYLPNYDWRASCVCPELSDAVAVVGIVHSDDPQHYDHLERLGHTWNAIVAVSPTIAETIAERFPQVAGRVVTIPYGVPLPPQILERAAGPGAPLRMIYTGRLVQEQKRVMDLVPIVNELLHRQVPVELTLVGEGAQHDELRTALAAAVASGCVRFAGTLANAEVLELLARHDVLLLTSEFEGLPVSLLEAMGRGCVPVVTDVASGVRDVVHDGDSGYRVPIGDIGAFVARLTELQRSPALRQRMSERAFATVREGGYDLETMARRYLALFERVLREAELQIFQRPQGAARPLSWMKMKNVKPRRDRSTEQTDRAGDRSERPLLLEEMAVEEQSVTRARLEDPSFLWDSLFLRGESLEHWQMGSSERFVLLQMLKKARPRCAIEIGTYKGGSLQVLSRYAEKVYAIDLDPAVEQQLAGQYSNVEFRIGDSKRVLPELLASLQEDLVPLEFVLIDGSHETEGVRADIDNLLQFRPVEPIHVVMHDSFNPDCRAGILGADWEGCPYVQAVVLDYLIGNLFGETYEKAQAGTMYGGFALALMLPEERQHELQIYEGRHLFETALKQSVHYTPPPAPQQPAPQQPAPQRPAAKNDTPVSKRQWVLAQLGAQLRRLGIHPPWIDR